MMVLDLFLGRSLRAWAEVLQGHVLNRRRFESDPLGPRDRGPDPPSPRYLN